MMLAGLARYGSHDGAGTVVAAGSACCHKEGSQGPHRFWVPTVSIVGTQRGAARLIGRFLQRLRACVGAKSCCPGNSGGDRMCCTWAKSCKTLLKSQHLQPLASCYCSNAR